MSNTPRTDKSLLSKIERWGKAIGYDDLVLAAFARELERENAALRQEIEKLKTDLGGVNAENKSLGKAFDRLASMANHMRYNMEYELKDK